MAPNKIGAISYKDTSQNTPVAANKNATPPSSNKIMPKVLIGAGLAALATTGIYIASRGRSSKVTNELGDKLKKLTGAPQEIANSIKDIFMKDMGYDSGVLDVKVTDDITSALVDKRLISGGYNFITGDLLLKPKLFETDAPVGQAAALIRHELDHFDKSVKLFKSIGAEEYQKLFEGILNPDGTQAVVNMEFFERAARNTDIANFDAAKYKKAIQEYFNPKLGDSFGFYRQMLSNNKYLENPLETSAFEVQDAVLKSLKIPSYISKSQIQKSASLFEKMDSELEKLANNPAYGGNKSMLYSIFYETAITETEPKLIEAIKKLAKNPHDEKILREYQELFQSISLSKLNLTPEEQIKYSEQISERIINLIKNADSAVNKNTIPQMFELTLESLNQQCPIDESGMQMIPQEILPGFKKLTDDYLKYIEFHKLETTAPEGYIAALQKQSEILGGLLNT